MATNKADEIPWSRLVQQIFEQRFTPVISNRVSCNYLFKDHDVVKEWATKIGYPLTDVSNLARVAQFDRVFYERNDEAAKDGYLNFLKGKLLEITLVASTPDRRKDLEKLRSKIRFRTFSEAAALLGYFDFEKEPNNPLFVLAQLPLPIFLTTSYHTFLEMALHAAGKQPQSRAFCWCDELQHFRSRKFEEYLDEVKPSIEEPLVYHVLGIDTVPKSLVLSEDDFFDFLDNVALDLRHSDLQKTGRIPVAVRRALPASSLVLLGYNLYDWDFRAAFRGAIKKLERHYIPLSFLIQFRSGLEYGIKDKERVREYLKKYVRSYEFYTHWGDVESFTQKLKQNWDDAGLTVTSISTEPEKKQTAPPTVFVSYSHKDKKEKDDLLIQLKVIKGAGLIDHWSDDRIGAGAEWEQEIHQAIAQARVAILLISANFLASDFINDIEVPALLERHEREELTIFPVIARDCAWERVEWLAKMNVRPENGEAVWGDGGIHADRRLKNIAEEVADIVKEVG